MECSKCEGQSKSETTNKENRYVTASDEEVIESLKKIKKKYVQTFRKLASDKQEAHMDAVEMYTEINLFRQLKLE